MQTLTPEEQACLEWAYRSATDAFGKLVFVSETGQVWARGEQFFLDPNSSFHGWIALLAQAVECHLAGMKPGEQRRNLLAAGVREEAANFVHDHLADVSVVEMADLRQRVQFYRDDKARRDGRSTTLGGLS